MCCEAISLHIFNIPDFAGVNCGNEALESSLLPHSLNKTHEIAMAGIIKKLFFPFLISIIKSTHSPQRLNGDENFAV